MPRMSKIQIAEMKNEYNNGIKPKDLMSKYNISKHALYHHVDKEKAVKTKEAVIEKTEKNRNNRITTNSTINTAGRSFN